MNDEGVTNDRAPRDLRGARPLVASGCWRCRPAVIELFDQCRRDDSDDEDARTDDEA